MRTLIILLFTISLSFGQSKGLSKEDILQILKENDSKNWTTCDSDSLFYKSEIIYLDNIQDFKCWKYVTWRFKSLKEFWLVNGEKKHGLTKTTILTENNFYRLKIIDKENEITFKIYRKEKLVETFLAIDAGYNDSLKCNRITLKRIK
jgi:hypothetical protein